MKQVDDVALDFSEEEKEILQEVINIAFGKAAGDLAEVIEVFILLSVPNIVLLSGKAVSSYISNELDISQPFHIISQSFTGRLDGHACLIFPSGAEKKLAALFDNGEDSNGSEDMNFLEKETLMEVGNILSGACVGKLVELLNDVVTFTPPQLTMEVFSSGEVSKHLIDPESVIISIKTDFKFEDHDVSGHLFIITNEESIVWLKKALHIFIEQF